jgi:ferredoxin
MKAAMRYFSGTGNAWKLAAAGAERLRKFGYETDAASIQTGKPPDPDSAVAAFCFPVHSLDLPRNAVNYLDGLPACGRPIPAVLLVTGSSPDNCGWSLETGMRLLSKRGYTVRIAELVQMPTNWTPFHSGSDAETAARMIAAGVQKTRSLFDRFQSGEICHKPVSLRVFGPVGSGLMRTLYHGRGAYNLWRFFEVGDRCTGCGLCARICPTGSIHMKGKKPVWKATCVQCMRCFNYCPNRAIRQLEFLLHGSRHRAYHLPEFHPAADT